MRRKNGLWLLPTRRRIGTLQRFFDAAVRRGLRGPGRVIVNSDELAELRDQYEQVRLPQNWEIVSSPHTSLCETYRGALPIYRDLEWVGALTDDVVPETREWEAKLFTNYDGRTIITCDDGMQAPRRMCGAHIWPLSILKAVGYWFPAGFKHCFVDNVWEELGRETGCWKVDMKVLVRHEHPWAGGAEDDTYRHAYSAEFWANDEAQYHDWQRYYKPIALRRLRAFLERGAKEAA